MRSPQTGARAGPPWPLLAAACAGHEAWRSELPPAGSASTASAQFPPRWPPGPRRARPTWP
eukprot:6301593-Alexandrium_andersonii.AAC.1